MESVPIGLQAPEDDEDEATKKEIDEEVRRQEESLFKDTVHQAQENVSESNDYGFNPDEVDYNEGDDEEMDQEEEAQQEDDEIVGEDEDEMEVEPEDEFLFQTSSMDQEPRERQQGYARRRTYQQ